MDALSIPDEVVSKYYQMDPATEDILMSGNDLRDGMIILVENDSFRPDEWITAEDCAKGSRYARWCMVSNLELGETMLKFVGIYSDGVKRFFHFSVGQAWYVKIDSIPTDRCN